MFIIGCLGLLNVNGVRADWFVDASAEFLSNDNLNRAELKSDIRSDTSLQAAVAGGDFSQIATYTGLTASAAFTLAHHQDYSDLNNHTLNLGLAFNHKFGVGEKVPRLNGSLGISERYYQYAITGAFRTGLSRGRIDSRRPLAAISHLRFYCEFSIQPDYGLP